MIQICITCSTFACVEFKEIKYVRDYKDVYPSVKNI